MRHFSHTRIAPTPSGYLHLGNACNFLLTSKLAKQSGASLLLRIDDMDRERLRPEYLDDVFETLHWLNIEWQLGPEDATDFEESWSQRRRMDLYNDALENLRQQQAVFACNCTRTQLANSNDCNCAAKQLSLDTPGVSWRLHTDLSQLLIVHAPDGGTISTTLPVEMKNFVIKRKDGLPAYQLTSVVDDVHFGIDLIIRGQDLWPSTLAQLYIAKLLGFDTFLQTAFVHHPLLTNAAGAKLSKSAGASSLKEWRAAGRTREELVDYIERLLPDAFNA